MPKGSSRSTAHIQRLLDERRQYEAWIARLNNAADATPGPVRARVRADYEERLTAVIEELKEHAANARQAIEQKKHLRTELQKKETHVSERLTEIELRHAVGEFDEGQWVELHKDVLAELVSVREDLQAVEADLLKLEELDAIVGNKPRRSGPVPPPKPVPRPAARPEPTETVQPSHVDELAFLKSVTEDEASAPSPRRASGAQFQPSIPADATPSDSPTGPPQPRAANPMPAPIVPDAAGVNIDEEVAKTLRCKQCGTMNLPTEWYCAQCGIELDAV